MGPNDVSFFALFDRNRFKQNYCTCDLLVGKTKSNQKDVCLAE